MNNAGILIPSPVAELEPPTWQAMLEGQPVRRSVHHAGGAAGNGATRKRGSIVNVASLAGRRGVTPLGGYCASKFALVGITEALRMEAPWYPRTWPASSRA